jgi:hypothetical protein
LDTGAPYSDYTALIYPLVKTGQAALVLSILLMLMLLLVIATAAYFRYLSKAVTLETDILIIHIWTEILVTVVTDHRLTGQREKKKKVLGVVGSAIFTEQEASEAESDRKASRSAGSAISHLAKKAHGSRSSTESSNGQERSSPRRRREEESQPRSSSSEDSERTSDRPSHGAKGQPKAAPSKKPAASRISGEKVKEQVKFLR